MNLTDFTLSRGFILMGATPIPPILIQMMTLMTRRTQAMIKIFLLIARPSATPLKEIPTPHKTWVIPLNQENTINLREISSQAHLFAKNCHNLHSLAKISRLLHSWIFSIRLRKWISMILSRLKTFLGSWRKRRIGSPSANSSICTSSASFPSLNFSKSTKINLQLSSGRRLRMKLRS